jgi:hypothetical protein
MSTQKKATMDEETKCPVCYEQIGENNAATMNCGHAFHFTCITSNILKGSGDHSMNCPMCRKLIVDEEFAESRCEVIYDSDADSMPSLEEFDEEADDLWEGTQLWRRDLAVRDRVKMEVVMDTTGEMLNRMGWDLNDADIITTRYDEYEDSRAVIFCEVVCVIDTPLPEMAPFLLKPVDGRNRLQLQAYQPKQHEVLNIELLRAEWRNEPLGDRLGTWSEQEAEDRVRLLEPPGWVREQEILKRQIHDMPMCEITTFVDDKIKNLGFNKKYNFETVKSMIHKIMIDVIMEHKRNIEDAIDNLHPQSDADTYRGAIPLFQLEVNPINPGFN